MESRCQPSNVTSARPKYKVSSCGGCFLGLRQQGLAFNTQSPKSDQGSTQLMRSPVNRIVREPETTVKAGDFGTGRDLILGFIKGVR